MGINPQYLEMGRVEWAKVYGISYKTMGRKRNNVACNFLKTLYIKKSAVYDDLLTVKTFIRKRPMVRIEFDYEIRNDAKEIVD